MFFKKNDLMRVRQGQTDAEKADQIFKNIFRVKFDTNNQGFNRLRSQTRTYLTSLIQTLLTNIKQFDFNYYLSKSCPLPPEWKTKKMEIRNKKFLPREQKTEIYEWLHDQTVKDKFVSQFLNEFFYNTLPDDFLEKRNRKQF